MGDETTGERIAKVMARAGIASRRDAEKMILAGRVAVNGRVAVSPALDVTPADKVTLDGKPIDAPQPARLWLYCKPLGLVTSARDEKGRQTVFDTMPEGMPRVISVGRLDINSEGLLLLTNDGALKRRLELPETGWLRKYRVRVNGRPNDATFDPLRRGVSIAGEDFLPMEITLDRQQGANAWLTVGLREGRNREIRRAMAEVGLTVNRLIRVSYGPFRLNLMKPGDVVEVKARVLREQLGASSGAADASGTGVAPTGGRDAARKPRNPRRTGAGDGAPDSTGAGGADSRDRKGRTSAGPGAKGGASRSPAAPREAAGADAKARKPPRSQASKGHSPDAGRDRRGSRQDGPKGGSGQDGPKGGAAHRGGPRGGSPRRGGPKKGGA